MAAAEAMVTSFIQLTSGTVRDGGVSNAMVTSFVQLTSGTGT